LLPLALGVPFTKNTASKLTLHPRQLGLDLL
jgi:hypothetical protein